jgi:acetyl-CoA acyltransferase
MGPAITAPIALDRAGLGLRDLTLVDMHEAFAAQVLSNIAWLGSKSIAETKLGRSEPVGEIDPEAINPTGGSIAIGHPFGATGARIVTSVCNHLGRTGKQYGLISVCAAGGQGSAIVVERE